LLHKLSVFYSWAYPDTGYTYAQQALDLAEELNYEDGIMWSQQIMSRALINLGNYPLALDYTFKSLSLAEKNHDTLGIILAKASLVMTYRELGDYKSSLAYGQNILNLEELLHRKDIIYTWADLSSVYEKNNQLDSAIKYGKKAYEMDYNQSDLLVVLGNSYAKKGNYDSAMFYYRAGPPVAVLSHSEIDLIDIYSGIAIVYKAKGNLDSAVWYAKKALNEKSGKTYPIGLLRAATILADLYEAQHNADSSLKYLKTAIS
jgi:tetratricopeptide (TPR) repeat protein